MFLVGLTGGIGSGKSEASNIFKKIPNVYVVDLDEISKRITQKNKPGFIKIIEKYGNYYLNPVKELDRKKIQVDIFNSKKIKKDIEDILHPIIYRSCIDEIKIITRQNKFYYAVIVIPLLFESDTYQDLVSETLLIDCEEKTQVLRVQSRDDISTQLINKIMSYQISRKEKQRKADKIIDNNSKNISKLKRDVIEYHENLIHNKLVNIK
jgi:dephospho-CoA kinase